MKIAYELVLDGQSFPLVLEFSDDGELAGCRGGTQVSGGVDAVPAAEVDSLPAGARAGVAEIVAVLDRYAAGDVDALRAVELPKGGPGAPTGFAVAVREELRTIAAGEARTYKELAEALDNPNGSRAVGGALASNPCLLFIPCHRVVQKGKVSRRLDGSTAVKDAGNYAGGVAMKEALLRHEGVAVLN